MKKVWVEVFLTQAVQSLKNGLSDMDVLPFDITTLKKLHGLWVGRYILSTKNVVEKYSYLETFINSYQSNCVHSCINTTSVFVNPLRPEDWYIRQWTGSSLIQVIACRLFSSDKWFPEPMVFYYELDPQGHTSVKLKKKFKRFPSRKWIAKYCRKMAAILPRPPFVWAG